MLLMTHYAGMRVVEVAALRVDDVLDKDGNVRNEIRLDADQTKGSRGRVVVVGDKLRKATLTHWPCYFPDPIR